MQSKWNTCPQLAKAIDRPFSFAALGLAWYSIEGSFREFLQIAQVSAHISHDHIVTAFHSDEGGKKFKLRKREMLGIYIQWVAQAGVHKYRTQ